ncbi:conserved hypothetical protein [Theileria orientalis strain Shintoku]|uniref:Uncharacterized protein n=1 Tax=Theileria orientalis strain Shintoku TaxID=869250 RepID=J4DQ51_THEOR|nr:conserved hypothetical protein [Theileria orientalis strain Shintoku]BAM41844.1 conserved hypothetical protein [Theileria orientalis strain Shintoku]|eukprot:XP_009692145.1 conserved hypothetical protein [Theileria orientalis strain Shintoku]
MLGSSESSKKNLESTGLLNKKTQNKDNDKQEPMGDKGLVEKFNLESLAEKLGNISVKPTPSFDDEKWSKICKITKNLLTANAKKYTEASVENTLSTLDPVVLSDNLKLPNEFSVSDQKTSFPLWNTNTLEFISLASLNRPSKFTFCFKMVDSIQTRPKYVDTTHTKHKIVNKVTPITIQGKQLKYDSTQLISLIQKTQRQNVSEKMNTTEHKGRVLEKFNLKTEVKIPPNWDKKVGYDHNKWDNPSYNSRSIFSLGPLEERKASKGNSELQSATGALKNLSCLVQDFQVGKKSQAEGSGDDLSNLNISDINNFAFVDEDVDDSLKCSKFSKFFKVLKDQQVCRLTPYL